LKFEYSTISLTNQDKPEIILLSDNMSPLEEGKFRLNFSNLIDNTKFSAYVNDKNVVKNVNYGKSSSIDINLGEFLYMVSGKSKDSTPPNPISLLPSNKLIYTIFFVGNKSSNLLLPVVNNPGLHEKLAKNFDIKKYMGLWNLTSEIPQPYLEVNNCVNQTALYTLLQDNVKVYNNCYDSNGEVVRSILGSAVSINSCFPAALKVSFPGKPSINNEANYLIHFVEYEEYAIIGSPNRASLYILSRSKKMSMHLYNKLVNECDKLGYDTNKLKIQQNSVY